MEVVLSVMHCARTDGEVGRCSNTTSFFRRASIILGRVQTLNLYNDPSNYCLKKAPNH